MNSNIPNSGSDDEPELPADTLQILQEFLRTKQEREEAEEKGTNPDFEENWQLSQFWYSDKTKADLTKVCQELIKNIENCKIGLLSCPSLYLTIKNIHPNVNIFEYDRRFESFGDDFIFYDFNNSENPDFLNNYEKTYDIIIADPPFLSEDCIRKVAIAIKKLMKDEAKIIFCTGEVAENWIMKYLNLKKCNYVPEHERILGNPFKSYANFNLNNYL